MSIPSCRFDGVDGLRFHPCHFDFLSPSIQCFDVAFFFGRKPRTHDGRISFFLKFIYSGRFFMRRTSKVRWFGSGSLRTTWYNLEIYIYICQRTPGISRCVSILLGFFFGGERKKHVDLPCFLCLLFTEWSEGLPPGTVAAYWRQLYLEPLGGERGNWSLGCFFWVVGFCGLRWWALVRFPPKKR